MPIYRTEMIIHHVCTSIGPCLRMDHAWGGGGVGNYQKQNPAQQKKRKKILQSKFTHSLTSKWWKKNYCTNSRCKKKFELRKIAQPPIPNLNDWSRWQQWICFPRISMFPETSRKKHWDSRETKFTGFPRDQSLRDLLYSKTYRRLSVTSLTGVAWNFRGLPIFCVSRELGNF